MNVLWSNIWWLWGFTTWCLIMTAGFLALLLLYFRVNLVLAWYDLWVGAYYDRARRHLYLMVPMIGLRISRKE